MSGQGVSHQGITAPGLSEADQNINNTTEDISNKASGHKANLSNPNTSEESKKKSAEALKALGGEDAFYGKQAEYLKAVMYEGVTILEGTATWCKNCHIVAPEVAKMVAEYPNVKFYTYDVEECEDIAQELGVRSMPSFSVFKDGDIMEGVTGAKPKEVRRAIEGCL
ncbi:uncharacterized protein J4E88_010678 [Alternaria novae-zelandiae]|uniref:uncharacterized protein n=1 Tax=Alternaria novae-zelandiae TaxID=430562 RepID=UPI0020C26E5F|nr:uncharacterized protein J4E88_010678 [Alternaria novae-zelandiae]KAI4664534.1 hypothetical protein J4E88_010678 [Alternaria novae-zelandiae]